MMGLAVNDRAYDEVRAQVMVGIKDIRSFATSKLRVRKNEDGDYYQYVVDLIDQFMDEPGEFKIPSTIKAPDGSPIGSCDF